MKTDFLFRIFITFCLTILFAVAQSKTLSTACKDNCTSEELSKFEEFKKNFSKSYLTDDDECLARGYFCKNYRQFIDHSSKKNCSFKMSLNANADQPSSGIRATGHIPPPTAEIAKRNATTASILKLSAKMQKNSIFSSQRLSGLEVNNGPLTGPVKDQGFCGSCWAFCTNAVLNYQALVYRNQTIDLSEQDVIDCNDYSSYYGCNGGSPIVGMGYIFQKGATPLIKYPYRQTMGKCRKSSNMGPSYKSPWDVATGNPNGNVNSLRSIINKVGVVALGIGVSTSLNFYESGIFEDPNCPTNVSHCVTLVGYGTDNKFGDYWILKNSWGTDWGEKGYFRLKSGVNTCGIETSDFYVPLAA